ncbi:hypothetical protein [Gulosibacter sp. 10]|uniref:hypothetical protein n=1 Tax=Gulosibacter sp. 10 TaxID=1255570 RepID=UPI00097F28B6|nr:hypothetical protein [Gulosibacter sp. 10]SJM60931.1 hypothetical protein FM112_07470 [Gulosibacter sp. 10]
MNEYDSTGARLPGLDPQDLDGHTIEELSDYLDAGRAPADPSIDESPACRIALESLERLHALAPELFAADTAAEPEPEEGWVQNILEGIALDARAGRRIPITVPKANADLGITEGAVRGLIRAVEYSVPGVFIGACRFDGDVTVPGEPVRVGVEISVPYGASIPDLADRLRVQTRARLSAQTTLHVIGIDIAVTDIRQARESSEGER